jgi:hypothetical protein
MADNKLNYQQARRIRKSKFSDMVLDQLADKDTGVLGAIGKTISLRSQAKIKGFKEKFDPLNIVKFMTMGSRFGPALFGKLTGRSQKDIDYFTGRTKSVIGGRNTAEKLKGVGGGDSEGINEQLSKIFSFLKSNREEDVRLRELAKNSEEEIAFEKGRRHKELIDTLQKLMKQINSGGTVTAEPVKETSFLDGLWEKLKGLAELVSMMKDTLLKIAEKIGMRVASALTSAGQWGARALGAAAASGGLTVGGVLAGGAAITYGATNVLSNMTDEQRQQLQSDVGSDTALAAAALNSPKSKEDAANYEKSLEKYRKYMEDAPLLTRMSASLNPAAAGDYLRNEAKIPKRDLEEFEKFEIIPPGPTAAPVKKENAPVAPAQNPPGNEPTTTTPAQNENLRPTMKNDPRLINQAPTPASAPVSNLTNTNIDLNLTNTKSTTVNKNPIVNKTTNISNTQERSGLRPSEISVRNDEPTFMRLIQDATRLV